MPKAKQVGRPLTIKVHVGNLKKSRILSSFVVAVLGLLPLSSRDFVILPHPFSPELTTVIQEAIPTASAEAIMYQKQLVEDPKCGGGKVEGDAGGPDCHVKHGDTGIMISVLVAGLIGICKVTSHTSKFIHGHRAGWGMLNRQPASGMSISAMQTLCYLASSDQYCTSGDVNKSWEPNEAMISPIRTHLQTRIGTKSTVPVLLPGQTAAVIRVTYHPVSSAGHIQFSGIDILLHSDASKAGVKSMQAALQGKTRDTAQTENTALTDAYRSSETNHECNP